MDIKAELVTDFKRLADRYPHEMIASIGALHGTLITSRHGAQANGRYELLAAVARAHTHLIEMAMVYAHCQGWDLDTYKECYTEYLKHADTVRTLLTMPDDDAVEAALRAKGIDVPGDTAAPPCGCLGFECKGIAGRRCHITGNDVPGGA